MNKIVERHSRPLDYFVSIFYCFLTDIFYCHKKKVMLKTMPNHILEGCENEK